MEDVDKQKPSCDAISSTPQSLAIAFPKSIGFKAIYVVITSGKHIVVSMVLVSSAPMSKDKMPTVTVLDTMLEFCGPSRDGSSDIARMRHFVHMLTDKLHVFVHDNGVKLTAVLIKTPHVSPKSSIYFIRELTWMEAFVTGALFGHFPATPAWYVNIKDVYTSMFGFSKFSGWEEETAAIDAMAKSIAPTNVITHTKEALCVIIAAYHFKKFSRTWH